MLHVEEEGSALASARALGRNVLMSSKISKEDRWVEQGEWLAEARAGTGRPVSGVLLTLLSKMGSTRAAGEK